jgi:hypothetical protein
MVTHGGRPGLLLWSGALRFDPLPSLLNSTDGALGYFARRDLLGENTGAVSQLWQLEEPRGILKRQLSDAGWRDKHQTETGRLIPTFKNLQALTYRYGFNASQPAVERACEYLFSFQTTEGDFRGFIGNQYAPYYTGLAGALLIEAGYAADTRIEKALSWLLAVRQDDGGWVIGSPGMTGIRPNRQQLKYYTSDRNAPTLREYDRSKPFSHSGTGMVIRAFAAHPKLRRLPEALKAGALLKSHFFKEDNYGSYRAADHWLRFEYPFWWNSLLAALDSLALLGFPPNDPDIKKGLDWFTDNQQADGLWQASYSAIHKAPVNSKTETRKLWVSLAVCRVFKKFFG